MKKLFFCLASTGILFLAGNQSQGQTPKDEFTQLMADDSVDMNSIAIYPQKVRENIFRISAHNEGIAKIDDAQKKSQDAFRNLVAPFSKEEQKKIWDLTRYDDLVSQLAATNGRKRKVEQVLAKFPAEIHDNAYAYATNHKELIASLDKMNKDFNSSFQYIISGYSPDDQQAFRDILKTPEAFSLLSKNMHLAVHLGDIYKSDPDMLRREMESLNLVNAELKAREIQDWKQEMKDNPDAEKEMEQSADEYAKDNGYNENEIRNTDPKIIEHYVVVPYPYWTGYPWWYDYPYWYPYPYWYHSGFYFWNGEVIWLGPPSWYFIHWHFHHHPHFYHYPHLTNVYINHYYYGPRRPLSGNTVEVRTWMRDNEASLPRDFKSNTPQRVDRIKELGKAEMDLDNYHQNNPGKTLSRDEFIKEHIQDYPHLKQPVITEPEKPGQPEVSPSVPKASEQPKDKQKPAAVPSKPSRPIIKKEQNKPEWKAPVEVKPSTKPTPKIKPVQPRKPEVTPRPSPSKPQVPAQPKNDNQMPGRKKGAVD